MCHEQDVKGIFYVNDIFMFYIFEILSEIFLFVLVTYLGAHPGIFYIPNIIRCSFWEIYIPEFYI